MTIESIEQKLPEVEEDVASLWDLAYDRIWDDEGARQVGEGKDKSDHLFKDVRLLLDVAKAAAEMLTYHDPMLGRDELAEAVYALEASN